MSRIRIVALAGAWILGLAGGAGAADWPTLQQNNRRTGYTDEPIPPPYTEVWRHDLQEMIDCRVEPIVSGGLVLVSSYKGLHALSAADGSPKWVFRPGGPIFSSPSVAGGRTFVSSQDRNIYAIDLATGKEVWHFTTGEGVWASPAVEDGTVYVGSRDGVFYALSAEGGKELWRFETPQPILLTAAIEGDVVYFASENIHAYAVNRKTGKLVWDKPMIGQSVRSYWPVVSDKFVYYRTLPVRSFWQHDSNVKVDTQNPDRLARVKAWLEKDPFSRCFFAFDRKTGEDVIFPVLWTAGGGTVPFPPVVLPDGRIVTPAPAGERTSASGTSSVSIIDEATRQSSPGHGRVIADESYGYSVAGPILFSSHHDYLKYVDLRSPANPASPDAVSKDILGKRDRPVDDKSAQWFGNHDNHPGWHAASLAGGRVYWITEGSWVFTFKGGQP